MAAKIWSAVLAFFAFSNGGSIAVMTALILPPLCVLAVSGIEVAEVVSAKAQLQQIVDSAALAGATQLSFDQSSATQERTRVFADGLANKLRNNWTITTSAQSDATTGTMTATQDANRPSFFGNLLPPGGWKLHVTATALQNAKKPLCVLGLQTAGQGVLYLTNAAVVTANGCLVQSDTDLVADTGTQVTAGAVRTVGRATGSISPAPVTDAPISPDPFATLNISVPTTCNDKGFDVKNGTISINPGVHCGDLKVSGNGALTFNPGEHYFVNSAIVAKDQATVSGTDVVLILKKGLEFSFKDQASLSLEGRRSGPYAGFAIVADRSFTGTLDISTDSARKLFGTIYLPNATLAVSGLGNKVADQSPWTVVVAYKMQLSGSANLVINSSYAATTVPVPVGVGSNTPRLTN